MTAHLFRPIRWMTALLAGVATVACAKVPSTTPRAPDERLARPGVTSVGTISAPEINESSGLVASRRHAGIFWTHNDSGDRPRIFAIDRNGAKLAEYAVEGATAVDWEDIAIDDDGRLYLGDVGNNGNDRRDLAVYVIPEPDPARSGPVRVERALRFRYADQTAFPEAARLEFDCEAMLHWNGGLYLFSKHRGNTRTKLYRLDTGRAAAGGSEVALAPLATIELGGPSPFGVPTAADISADGRYVALLTYLAVFIYERHGDDLVPDGPVARIELDAMQTRQAESVAWDGAALVFGNEQRGLFRLESPLAPSLWRYPAPASAR
jgi:hypothetical protein